MLKHQCWRRKMAFMIRTYDPSASALERIRTWCSDLLENCQDWLEVICISVDCTKKKPHVIEKLEQLQMEFPNGTVVLHCYTENDMIDMYPVLKEMKETDATILRTKELRTKRYSLAWGFHVEPLNLWFQELEEKHPYVWVFEDDVAFSGDLSLFLNEMEKQRKEEEKDDDDPDFIADDMGKISRRWWWANTVSGPFGQQITISKRFHAREHVQYFSKKILDYLHNITKTERITAWGEQFAPTICRWKSHRFKLKQLPRKYIAKNLFAFDGRITKSQWQRILKSKSPRPKNKLYHALKF